MTLEMAKMSDFKGGSHDYSPGVVGVVPGATVAVFVSHADGVAFEDFTVTWTRPRRAEWEDTWAVTDTVDLEEVNVTVVGTPL
jgi:hypothetical protein